MTHWPLGLFSSEAIFARNLFGATPADAVRESSRQIVSLISCAMSVALPWHCSHSVTSRKASSRLRGSIYRYSVRIFPEYEQRLAYIPPFDQRLRLNQDKAA